MKLTRMSRKPTSALPGPRARSRIRSNGRDRRRAPLAPAQRHAADDRPCPPLPRPVSLRACRRRRAPFVTSSCATESPPAMSSASANHHGPCRPLVAVLEVVDPPGALGHGRVREQPRMGQEHHQEYERLHEDPIMGHLLFVPRSRRSAAVPRHGAGLEARTQILARAATASRRENRSNAAPAGRAVSCIAQRRARSTASSVGLPLAPPGVANPITRHDVT